MEANTTITGKAYNHISLEEAKKHLRVSPNFLDDDSQITALLKVATDQAANYIEKHVALTTLEHTRDEFYGCVIDIEESHLHSLQSIKYTNRVTGQAVTLSNDTGYTLRVLKGKFYVLLDDAANAKDLKVSFSCGYDAQTIEPVIKQAILIKLTDLYDIERASYQSGGFQKNTAFESLLNYHRDVMFY